RPTPAPAASPGGKITVGLNSDLSTLDPHKSTAAVDRQVFQLVYDKLVDIDEKLNIVPQLATAWEITDDGKTYTFTLVEGATFHDGTPFNAEAVKINFERMLDQATASPRRSEIQQVTKVEAPDAKTVVLTLSQPFAPLLATLSDRAGMIISPKALAEKGDDLARQPVGTGAFSFVEWVRGDHVTVKKNPNYWQKGLPYLDEVTYKPITEATQRLTGLKTNQLQMVDQIAGKDVEATKKDRSLVLSDVPSLGFSYITLHHGKPPFDNKALRQAVAYSLDRDGINKVVFFNTGQPGQTPIPPSSWAFDPSVAPYKQNYDTVRQKLSEGGKPNGFSFTMLVTNSPEGIQLAEVYKAQLGEAKIVANIELLEFATLLDRFNKGEFEAVSLGWSGRPDPDGNTYNYFHSKGGSNRGAYNNPEVDKLLEQARAVADPAQRKQFYTQATKIIAEDVPQVFVRYPAEIKVWQPAVQGFIHIPDGMMRLTGVWLKK
ncbi:MAG: ABC transporter substrate-binding protein, partial [Chloroflexota bacterium]|nr:ABC transporter substrate-binding protein [Chloroflexota bacterium]